MKVIDNEIINRLKNEAITSPRLRSHFLMHSSYKAKVQRLLIGLVKGSFVEPHYHGMENQWEMFCVLEGEVQVKVYDDKGNPIDIVNLKAKRGEPQIIEFLPHEIHSVECVSDFALLMEVKEGPFDPDNAKLFPTWASNK